MTDMGELEAALAALGRVDPDDVVLDLIGAAVHVLVGDDLVHRLVPFAGRLRDLDYRAHPWAGLPCGVAICAVDRPRGRVVLSAARRHFETVGDATGRGYGCFLEGLQDLGEGDLDGAQRWWAEARPYLGSLSAARMIGSHLALSAYVDGDVGRAVVLGEQGLWAAEQARDLRAESIACVGLALFHLSTGRFRAVEEHVRRGLAASEQLDDENRYEQPMLWLGEAALHSMRDEHDAAEAGYERALADARRRGNRWYESIGLATRAVFTAREQPTRAVRDALAALEYLDSVGETWWSRSARLAFATAHVATGNLHAARAACEDLLALDLNPWDRGRVLTLRAEIGGVSGDAGAVDAASEAARILDHAGATYWSAAAEIVLARIDRRRADHHRRRAEQLAGEDRQDPAWRRLLRGSGRLRIDLDGAGRASIDRQPIRFQTRAELELVAMLVVQPSGVNTLTIGDRLWPNDDAARVAHRIDNLVSGLRRRLLPAMRVRRERGSVALDLLDGECPLRDALEAARSHSLPRRSGHLLEREQILRILAMPLLPELHAPWLDLARDDLALAARRLASAG